jgi:hypothetical protein
VAVGGSIGVHTIGVHTMAVGGGGGGGSIGRGVARVAVAGLGGPEALLRGRLDRREDVWR